MTYKLHYLLSFFLTLSALLCSAQLRPEKFVNPPDSSRPMTWMHMLNGNASKEGLEKDLRGLKDAGVGGALIFSLAYHGIPAGEAEFNSPKFREVLNHGIQVADELGLKIGLHNCDGWSSSGGPWITVEESMKNLVWSEMVTEGGSVDLKLRQPEARYDYYRDLAVVAIPSNQEELKSSTNRPKVTSSAGAKEAAKLFDGDLANGPSLRKGKGKKKGNSWIQLAFEAPFSAKSLRIESSSRNGECKLMVSDDGKDFTELVHMKTNIRPGKKIFGMSYELPEVSARYYRFEFIEARGRGLTVHEIDLTSYPRRAGWMAEGGMARHDGAMLKVMREAKTDLSRFVPMDQVRILSTGETSKGQLKVDLPDGIWRVIRFGYTTTGAKNHPATEAGLGFECDKLAAEPLEKHFENYLGKVIEEAGDLAGKSLLYSEIDSYEMGWQNWTDNLEGIFKDKKGYDLIQCLPLIVGHHIGDPESAKAICADFRTVVTDLMTVNYFERFTELCHEHGLKTYIEPYGQGPLNDIEVGGRCDIPMGEFWMSETSIVRSAVHAGHVYGKPVISAESFTSWADLNWKGHPYLMKEYGDKAWTEGINEFMFHRFAHQPNTHVLPGMTMGSVGSHIDRTQTWWLNAGKAWNEYNQRGSFLLRQGVPVSDVLVYFGDSEPTDTPTGGSVGVPRGYQFDSCSAEVLHERITVKKGKLVLPEGTRYAVLALTDCERIHLSSLQRLQQLAEAGATIVGLKPQGPISYLEAKEKAKEFGAIADAMWGERGSTKKVGEGVVVHERKLPNDLKSLGQSPDLLIEEDPKANFMHRKVGPDDVYFIHHRGEKALTYTCSFRIGDRLPELWHADTGRMETLAKFKQREGRTEVEIDLDPKGSVFVVFRKPSLGFDPVTEVSPASAQVLLNSDYQMELVAVEAGKHQVKTESGEAFVLETGLPSDPISTKGAWRVEFAGLGLKEDAIVDFPSLTDWKDHAREDIRHFSGTAAYRKLIEVPADWIGSNKKVHLDLGEVSIAAEVILNGKSVGTLWKPPFVIDVTKLVLAGENRLEVRVTNQWTNRLIGDQDLKDTSGYYNKTGSRPGSKSMPKWYTANQPMPAGPRSTFTTWNFYTKDRELLSGGLLGPVSLKQVSVIPLVAK